MTVGFFLVGTHLGQSPPTHSYRLENVLALPLSLLRAWLKCLLTPGHLFISVMFLLVRHSMFSLYSSLLSYSSSGPWAVLSPPVSPDTSPLTNRGP